MKKQNPPFIVNSISELHRLNGLPEPEHPMVSFVNFKDIVNSPADMSDGAIMNFYIIAIKRELRGKVRYGQSYYDFDEGVMSFIAPGQLCYEVRNDRPASGWMLLFHPDFIMGYPLAKAIKGYEFFSYAVNEALYLSKKEETMVENIMQNIEQEYHNNIDSFSQNLMVSQIDLLLNYSNRFYNRQFITRKNVNNDLVARMEQVLDDHYNSDKTCLPRVKDIAEHLNVSANYLSDMLRAHTGMNTQQHIHNKLIEKAKEILTTTQLTVSEIAYQLGFEYPQSFSKLFKTKTNVSPLEYRKLFN
jgi:AraC-like DNA-binding protein